MERIPGLLGTLEPVMLSKATNAYSLSGKPVREFSQGIPIWRASGS
jgi:hypothetical protein